VLELILKMIYILDNTLYQIL